MNSIADWSRNYRVEVGGDEVGSHAGNVITRMLADRTGLTEQHEVWIAPPESAGTSSVVTADRSGGGPPGGPPPPGEEGAAPPLPA